MPWFYFICYSIVVRGTVNTLHRTTTETRKWANYVSNSPDHKEGWGCAISLHTHTHTPGGHTGLRGLYSEWSSTLVLRNRLARYFWDALRKQEVGSTEPNQTVEPPHTELVTISTANAKQTVSVANSEHQTGQKGKVCSCWWLKPKVKVR